MMFLALLPVVAMVEPTKETFTGSATAAELVIHADRSRVSCRGWIETGLLSCSDGRRGRFTFSPAVQGGVARGSLAGKDITIVIG